MQLKLISDFSDYYDHGFDFDGYPFRRVTTDGPNRVEMISMFRHAGVPTPYFGHYKDFVRTNYSEDKDVVIYTDITKHCGEGKKKKRFGNICCAEREAYMMEYVPFGDLNISEYFSKSTRYLIIGDRCFTYDYFSIDDWRSNCGDGDISEPKEIDLPLWRYCIYYPLFAIDFVDDRGILRAIDLNIAPGTSGVGLNKLIPPSQVVLCIKKWFIDVNNTFDYFSKCSNG